MNEPESAATQGAPQGRSVSRMVLVWLLGTATCVVLALVVRHFSEELAFWRLLGQSLPQWLIAAALLQAGTYALQAQAWRVAVREQVGVLGFGKAYKLSLAALFVNQALPCGGISGLTDFHRRIVEAGPGAEVSP